MDRASSLPASETLDGVTVTPLDMRVVGVQPDGARVVRVWMAWGESVVHSDVVFDELTWHAHGGQ